MVSLKGPNFDLLGDHFHPVLVLLAPLYWIWADPRMLLLAQAALLAASALPVYRFSVRHIGRRPALVFMVAYGASWPIQAMVDFDFHEVAFAVPLIALTIDALDRHAYRTVFVCCVLLLAVREDMGAFVVAVALLLAFRHRVRLAAALAAIGVAGYLLATAIVLPALSPTHSFGYWSYDSLGPNLPSALWSSLRNPWRVVNSFFSPWRKSHTLIMLLAPTAFAAVGSTYLLLSLPFLAERFLSSREVLWTVHYQYSGVLAPIVAMAAVDTVGKLTRGIDASRALRIAFAGAAAAAVLVCTVFFVHLFPMTRLLNGGAFTWTKHMAAITQALRVVPSHVCVEADDRFTPHLTGRDYVSLVGRNPATTWLVIDHTHTVTGFDAPTPGFAQAQALSAGFKIVFEQDKVVVLHLDAPVQPFCAGPLD
jgi:uncharacterized membrane protein